MLGRDFSDRFAMIFKTDNEKLCEEAKKELAKRLG